MNKKEACERWVDGFNAFPYSMIEKLCKHDIDSWHEVTEPSVGDRVFSYDAQIGGEIIELGQGKGNIDPLYKVALDNGEAGIFMRDDFEVDNETGFLPMWGTLWQFGNGLDESWLENHLQEMSNCGFRIYEHDEWGYFFGIDGAGYDFYEAHWIPLYVQRGLQWHDEEPKEKAPEIESEKSTSLSSEAKEARDSSVALSQDGDMSAPAAER